MQYVRHGTSAAKEPEQQTYATSQVSCAGGWLRVAVFGESRSQHNVVTRDFAPACVSSCGVGRKFRLSLGFSRLPPSNILFIIKQ